MKSEYIAARDVGRLMQAMSYSNALAFELSCATGWRIGDVLRLRTSDLGEEMTISEQKTGKISKKRVPYALFCRLRAQAGAEWVFPGRRPGKHRTRQAVWADVRRAARLVGLETHVSPHTARKIYAVEDCRKNGLAHTQRELNHRDSAVTALYAFADTIIPDYKLNELAGIIAQIVLDKLAKA